MVAAVVHSVAVGIFGLSFGFPLPGSNMYIYVWTPLCMYMYICMDMCVHVSMFTCMHNIICYLPLTTHSETDPTCKSYVVWGSVVLCTHWAGVVPTYTPPFLSLHVFRLPLRGHQCECG